MRRAPLLRCLAAVLATLSAGVIAQSPAPAKPSAAIPATPATSAFASPSSLAPAPRSVQPAQVTYTSGLLTVSAANSSLNQILREIARATGMKITGSVRDDRVFGTYGPAAPSEILATLLDGTESNMLLVQKVESSSSELILTPRTGRASPPDPNAAARQEAEIADQPEPPPPPPQPQPQPQLPSQQRLPINPVNNARDGASPVDNTARPGDTSTPSSQSVAFPAITSGSTQSTGTTSTDNTQQPADGVKTPQQIFEQLQRMRQQQNTTTTNPQ